MLDSNLGPLLEMSGALPMSHHMSFFLTPKIFLMFRWSVGWGEYLATSRNIVYASIDGRGTGFQSDEYLYKVYRYVINI